MSLGKVLRWNLTFSFKEDTMDLTKALPKWLGNVVNAWLREGTDSTEVLFRANPQWLPRIRVLNNPCWQYPTVLELLKELGKDGFEFTEESNEDLLTILKLLHPLMVNVFWYEFLTRHKEMASMWLLGSEGSSLITKCMKYSEESELVRLMPDGALPMFLNYNWEYVTAKEAYKDRMKGVKL